MEKPNHEAPRNSSKPSPPARRSPNLWILLILMSVVLFVFLTRQGTIRSNISDQFLREQVEAGNVQSITLVGVSRALGAFKTPPPGPKVDLSGAPVADPKPLAQHFAVTLIQGEKERESLIQLLRQHGVVVKQEPESDNLTYLLLAASILVPVVLFIVLWVSFRRSQNQLMGGGFLSGFAKSPAKRYEGALQAVTFADVAGLDGVKSDLEEIVEYLKEPAKFQRLGGRVPKGVLLMGPPGTGKTLLARAVAGEAGVPFYSVSGSEFIQMFVGVGASRVRDLFGNAKETSPSIIFIDEIDAVGRQRGAGLGGGHDEREQTLNQILSEMDGFSQTDSVIVLAATNRPDVLDPALLRPGRFDRHITVSRPTQKGRLEIFKVHVRGVPLANDVDLERLASSTIGLTGADIRNLVNEAALWAARQDKSEVEMDDFDHARDKVLMGAKREEVMSPKEREKTAYHEAGHTLAAWYLPGADRVHKVTIVPRGRSLGSTQTMPQEDRLSIAETELRDHLVVLMAGRAAEMLIYNETTVGAENDLERATGMARRMVTRWGMSERLGPVSYKLSDDDPFLGREMHQQRQFSEHTMEVIDEEVQKTLHRASDISTRLLEEHRQELEKVKSALIEHEELDEAELKELIGPSVHIQPESNGRASPAKAAAQRRKATKQR